MRKLRKAIACLSTIVLSVSSLSPIAVSAAGSTSEIVENAIYVSTEGDDTTGDGSENNPYATLEGARKAVSRINNDMTGDITVYFREGTYYFNDTVEFNVEDSGTNGYFISYKAYPGETVSFNAGEKVEGWKKDADYPNLYSATLDRDKKLRQLYVNDHRAYMPSKDISAKGGYGSHTITEGEGDYAWSSLTKNDGVKFNASDLPANIINPEDVEVQSSMTWNTMTVAVRDVQTIDGYTVALFEQPYGVLAQNVGWAPYKPSGTNTVFNVFEFLDEPGEFYFDKSSKRLYYYPKEGEDMETAEVYAPKIDTLVRIEGENLESHASHIKFEGIIFENTDWMMHEIAGSHGKVATQSSLSVISTAAANWHHATYRAFDVTASAVEVTSADNIYFCNNIFRHTANDTLTMINDVMDSVVDGNIIYDTGSSGMSIGHPQHLYIGDYGSDAVDTSDAGRNQYSNKEKYTAEEEGVCTNIQITNNYMRDLAKLYYGSAGMIVYFGTELTIEHNYMENVPYSGISFGWGWGLTVDNQEVTTLQNNSICYNRIINAVNVLSDGGGIYTLGPMRGTVINENYISKIGQNGYHGRGIHIDEGTMYVTGNSNVIEVDSNQAAIDCGKWGSKGYNSFDNNYSTTASYTTTGNYEPGTTITNKHVNKSGYWSDEEPISIIRNSGLENEYLISMVKNELQDMVLPSSYRLTEQDGITEISVPLLNEEIWLAPEGTTEFAESDTVIMAKNGVLQIPKVEGAYYVYIISSDGTISEPSAGVISTAPVAARTDVLGPFWAADVTNNQGSKGDVSATNFGKSQNSNDTSNVFGIARDDVELSYERINGLDSSGTGWIGSVEKDVEVSTGGDYTLYILCFGSAGRAYNVYVASGDEDYMLAATTNGIIGTADSSSSKAYSTENCLNILEVTIPLEKGDNAIKLQGDGAGPNFVAMGLVKKEMVSDIPMDNLQLWLRADQGVTTDDNGKVIRWKDKSGNGHDAKTATISDGSGTGDTDPEYVKEGENGESVVRFDGVNDVLEFDFEDVISDKENVSVIIVSSNTSEKSGTNNANMYGDNSALLYFHENGSWGKFALTPYKDVISVRMPEKAIYHVDKADEDIGNDLSTTVFIKEGTTATIYDKQSAILHTNDNAPLNLTNTDDSVGYLGGYNVDSLNLDNFKGDIAEVIIYDGAIALGAVQAINAYLNEKYYTPKPQNGDTVELTGDLDIFNGEQTDGTTLPGPASKNIYVKNVFGLGGWQSGNAYPFGVDDDYRAAFDGTEENVNNYYDGPKQGYCGVEFNEPQIVTRIGFQARNGSSRLNGAVLQGSNDGTNYVDLYTIESSSDSEMRYVDMEEFENNAAYQFIRLIRNDTTVLNLYELKLYTIVGITEDDLKGDIPGVSDIPGDVNLDGKVTAVDALLALKMVVNEEYGAEQQRTNADVTYDGRISTDDVLLILQYASGEKSPEAGHPQAYGAVPNEAQLYYQKQGLSAFCHFGPNTFNNVEWGENYPEEVTDDLFALEEDFDAETLVTTLQDAGFCRIIITAKHHDGFCIWASDLTEYDISSTKYKDGKGDILEEISDACTKYNMDMGLYLSPWDIHEDKYGCYGDSKEGDYNEYYIGQIREICTAKKKDGSYKYGNNNPKRQGNRFVEWWMDGATGTGVSYQTYDWEGIFEAVRESNPECQMFGTHQAGSVLGSTGGIHWIGNEEGIAADETWSKVKAGSNYEDMRANGFIKGLSKGDTWSVPEVNTKILKNGWFWSSSKENSLHSLQSLGDLYYQSVGHGGVFLLNVSPNTSGTLDNNQKSRIIEFGEAIKDSFADDLTKQDGVTATASSVWGDSEDYGAANVLDIIPEAEEYDNTYWAPAKGKTTGTLEIQFPSEQTFNTISIEEYIQMGQKISAFSVQYRSKGQWEEFGSGSTISSKRLCRHAEVTADAIRINILSSLDTPMICNVGVYKTVDSFAVESDDTVKLPKNLSWISINDFKMEGTWGTDTYDDGTTGKWSDFSKKGAAEFTFTGTKAWIMGTVDPKHGIMDVYIDGEKIDTANTYNEERKMDQVIYTTPELEYDTHTVKIVITKDAIGIHGVWYQDGSGIFEVEKTEYNVLEGESMDVTIVRTCGSHGTVTVQYSTPSSGAEQGVNYQYLDGEVTFKDGETSKTITVQTNYSPNIADGLNFYFVLNTSSKATIGLNSSANIIIKDADV